MSPSLSAVDVVPIIITAVPVVLAVFPADADVLAVDPMIPTARHVSPDPNHFVAAVPIARAMVVVWLVAKPVEGTPEKERTDVGPITKKPGVKPSCRATTGASAPERARQEILPPPHMTNAQLKRLANEVVTLHRDIVAQNERLGAITVSLNKTVDK